MQSAAEALTGVETSTPNRGDGAAEAATATAAAAAASERRSEGAGDMATCALLRVRAWSAVDGLPPSAALPLSAVAAAHWQGVGSSIIIERISLAAFFCTQADRVVF